MKIVKESIEFKRGNSVTDVMNIGEYAKQYPPYDIEDISPGDYVVCKKSNHPKVPIKQREQFIILRIQAHMNARYLTYSFSDIEEAIKQYRDRKHRRNVECDLYSFLTYNTIVYIQKFKPGEIIESIDFKRGKDLKDAINIGEYRELTPPFDDVFWWGDYIWKRFSDGPKDPKWQVVTLNQPKQKFSLQTTWLDSPEAAMEMYENHPRNLEFLSNTHMYLSLSDYMDFHDIISVRKLKP